MPGIKKVVLLAMVAAVLVACAPSLREQFEWSLNQYGDLVRVSKFELASSFSAGTLFEEFSARVQAASNVRVVDYRVLGVKFDEQKSEAEARVEISYYTFSAYRVKTLLDVQKWVYREEGGKKQWRLMSLLPEFK